MKDRPAIEALIDRLVGTENSDGNSPLAVKAALFSRALIHPVHRFRRLWAALHHRTRTPTTPRLRHGAHPVAIPSAPVSPPASPRPVSHPGHHHALHLQASAPPQLPRFQKDKNRGNSLLYQHALRREGPPRL